jgi:hypothetical protein
MARFGKQATAKQEGFASKKQVLGRPQNGFAFPFPAEHGQVGILQAVVEFHTFLVDRNPQAEL